MIDRRMVNGSESIDEEDQASQVSQFLEGYKEGRIIKERIGGPSFMGFMSSFIGIGTVYIIAFVVVVMMLIRSINKGDDEHPVVATGDQIDHDSSEAESREHKSGEKED